MKSYFYEDAPDQQIFPCSISSCNSGSTTCRMNFHLHCCVWQASPFFPVQRLKALQPMLFWPNLFKVYSMAMRFYVPLAMCLTDLKVWTYITWFWMISATGRIAFSRTPFFAYFPEPLNKTTPSPQKCLPYTYILNSLGRDWGNWENFLVRKSVLWPPQISPTQDKHLAIQVVSALSWLLHRCSHSTFCCKENNHVNRSQHRLHNTTRYYNFASE
jgi:hypothetical protein